MDAIASPEGQAVELVIYGQPVSMKNRRKLIPNPRGKGMIPVLSDDARRYLSDLKKQVPVREPLLTEPLIGYITVYYASRRPDLDPAIILDGLQGRIFKNDRQLVELHLFKRLDPSNPRSEVRLEATQCQLNLR